MYTSVFAPEVQIVLDGAVRAAGTVAGPHPSPMDWRDQPIYFLMVDRFNNPNAPPVHTPFDDPHFDQFQGGTFSGVRQRLQYIKAMGFGAIWLSPVLQNLLFDLDSYHGYGIHDFLRAEKRFADNQANADNELRELVDAAHAVGLYVIFDVVLNHTGDVFAYDGRSEAPSSNAVLPLQWRNDSGVAQTAWTDIALIGAPPVDALVWPSELHQNAFFTAKGKAGVGGDDTVGDFDSLKQFASENRTLQGYLIRAYQYVIARFDIDGFRIDTLRYLRGNLAQTFGNATREFALSIGKKNFFTFGEVLDGNTEVDIARFIGRNTRQGGIDANGLVGVDAALDYPLFNCLRPVIKGQAPPNAVTDTYAFRKQTEQSILSSHGDATRYFVTFLDNHDKKERIRYVDPQDPTQYDDQVTLGIASLYALPGVPCIYYGTEQGLHGANPDDDAGVREALWGLCPAFPDTSFFYSHIQAIAKVREKSPALRYGRFYFRPISGDGINFGVSTMPSGILAWSRILNDQEVIIVASTGAAQSPSINVIVESNLSLAGDVLRILYSNKANPTAPAAVVTSARVNVNEVGGGTGTGPVNTVRVTLQPMEIQILQK